ncbi:hypothetical protein F5X68DRAFT_217402 [Plectosphaerella plurivora]|uniref:Uncharacterized protein n=1 Tax=Plectosphaerella plurivora TaxID=936078 RepID=A0A9P8V2Y5_9PEZI|nr:hypothetical protein F5X68DRAFT_217402 [Plectosphaerella plurivora]
MSASISADVSASASPSNDIASSSTEISAFSHFSTRTIPVFVPSPTYYPVPSQSHHYSNSSTATSPYPISSSTSSCTDDEATTTYKTSTVYTTKISTITSCPTYVPNCEDREPQVVTEVVPAYTTVCPVEVSTRTIKHVHTITSCPPSVPSTACPYGSKSTETLYSTITKVLEEPPKPSADYSKDGDESKDDDEMDDHDGYDEDGEEEETPLSTIHATTKYVYQTATVVPQPPTYSPTPPKNVTGPFRDGPSYEQITYPKPDLQAAAAPRSVGAGLAVVFGAAVAVLAL